MSSEDRPDAGDGGPLFPDAETFTPEPAADLALPEPGRWLIVRSGSIDLFLVERTAARIGSRMYLARIAESEPFPGLAGEAIPSGFAVVARVAAGTELASVDSAAILREPFERTELFRRALEWLGRAAFPHGVNDAAPIGPTGGTLSASGLGVVMCDVLVVGAQSGLKLEADPDRLGVGVDLPALLPRNAILRGASRSQLHARRIGSDPGGAVLTQAWDNTVTSLLASAADRYERRRAALDLQVEDRREADARNYAKSVVELADVVPGVAVSKRPEVSGDAVEAAIRRVCQISGVAVPKSDGPRTRPTTGLNQALEDREISYRPVKLTGSWWRADCGPILAISDTGPAHEPEGRQTAPVVLWRRRGRYSMWSAVTGETTEVDGGTAGLIEPEAFVVYRSLDPGVRSIRGLLHFAWRDIHKDLPLIILVGVLAGLLALATPIAAATVFNSIVPEANRGQLGVVLGFLVGAAIAQASLGAVRGLATLRMAAHAQMSIQPAVWDRVLALPVPFFRRFSTGDMVNRLLAVETVRQLVTSTVLGAILSLVFSVFSLALLFAYSALLAWCALGLVLVTNAAVAILAVRQVAFQRLAAKLAGHVWETLFAFLSHISELRVMGAESRVFSQWAEKFGQQRKASVSSARLANVSATVTTGFSATTVVMLFLVVGVALQGRMAAGSFIAFSAALSQFTVAMMAANASLVSVVSAIPQFERMRPIIEQETEAQGGGTRKPALDGSVALSHVSFSYGEDTAPVLSDVTMEIEPGEFIGVAGPSGAGKSTLIRLLLGFDEPTSGTISFNGVPMSSIEVKYLRSQLAVVLQDIRPMAGTVRDNIALGDVSDEAVWRAARIAELSDYIATLPMGMSTPVDDTGDTFSGGQLQRLLLARAVARDARIFLLDEATSALDGPTQAAIMEHMEAIKVTRIVVAHRLSTIRDADRIFYLDQGKIIESGTFDELMARGGAFSRQMGRQILSPAGSQS